MPELLNTGNVKVQASGGGGLGGRSCVGGDPYRRERQQREWVMGQARERPAGLLEPERVAGQQSGYWECLPSSQCRYVDIPGGLHLYAGGGCGAELWYDWGSDRVPVGCTEPHQRYVQAHVGQFPGGRASGTRRRGPLEVGASGRGGCRA